MEDAHATVLDFAGEEGKPTGNDKRLAFFGVYDGHGGDKVALYAGEHGVDITPALPAYRARLEATFRAALRPIAGIGDALDALDGLPRAVASSSTLPQELLVAQPLL